MRLKHLEYIFIIPWIILLSIYDPISLYAQDINQSQKSLTIDAYLKKILEKHPMIRFRKFDIQSQNQLWLAGLEKFNLNLNAQLSYNKDQTNLPKPAQILGSLIDQFNNEKYQATMGISRPFQIGSTLSFDLVEAYTKTNNPFRNCILGVPSDQCFEQRLTIRYTQPLLQGSGKEVVLAQQNQQKADIQVKEKQLALQVLQTLETCLNAYLQAELAQKRIEVQRENLNIAQEELNKNKAKVDLGVLAIHDLSLFELNLEQSQQSLLLLQQQFNQGLMLVNECMVYHDQTNERKQEDQQALESYAIAQQAHDFQQLLSFVFPDFSLTQNLADLEDQILKHPQIELIEAQIQSLKTQFPLLENLKLPKLDLDVFVSAGGLGQEITDSFNSINPDKQNRFYGATLTFQKPLSDEAKIRYQQALINLKSLEEQKNAQTQILITKLRQAFIRYQGAVKQIKAKEEVLKLSIKNQQGIQQKFQFGRALAFEVLDSNERLLQAKLSKEESLIEKKLALVAIWIASVQVFERFGLMLKFGEP